MSSAGQRWAARIGTLIGCTSWIVVLGIIVVGKGRAELLGEVVAPLLLASFGLGLLVLLATEPMLADGATRRRGVLTLSGGICFLGGLFLLLADGFVTPLLVADGQLAHIVRASGGAVAVPRWIATMLLALGAGMLLQALRCRPPVTDQPSVQVPTNRCAT